MFPSTTWGTFPAIFNEGNSIIISVGNATGTRVYRAVYRAGAYNAGSNITESGIAPIVAKMIDDKADDGTADGGRYGALVDCNNNKDVSDYLALAADCMTTMAKNIK